MSFRMLQTRIDKVIRVSLLGAQVVVANKGRKHSPIGLHFQSYVSNKWAIFFADGVIRYNTETRPD
jgi:hypothetical protein